MQTASCAVAGSCSRSVVGLGPVRSGCPLPQRLPACRLHRGKRWAAMQQRRHLPWEFWSHWKVDEQETVGVWELWRIQKSEWGSGFLGFVVMLISKTYKSGPRKELRVPFSNADLQCHLLSLATVLTGQISSVGGYHKFMSIGVMSQELAVVWFATCVFPGHPLGSFLLSTVSGSFAKIPTEPR